MACGVGWALGYNSKDWVLPMATLFTLGILSLLGAMVLWKMQFLRRHQSNLRGFSISTQDHLRDLKAFGRQTALFKETHFYSQLYWVSPKQSLNIPRPTFLILEHLDGASLSYHIEGAKTGLSTRHLKAKEICKLHLEKDDILHLQSQDSGTGLLAHFILDRSELD